MTLDINKPTIFALCRMTLGIVTLGIITHGKMTLGTMSFDKNTLCRVD
jgi:hypothetical protein